MFSPCRVVISAMWICGQHIYKENKGATMSPASKLGTSASGWGVGIPQNHSSSPEQTELPVLPSLHPPPKSRIANPQLQVGDPMVWIPSPCFSVSESCKGEWMPGASLYPMWGNAPIGYNGELIHRYLGLFLRQSHQIFSVAAGPSFQIFSKGSKKTEAWGPVL